MYLFVHKKRQMFTTAIFTRLMSSTRLDYHCNFYYILFSLLHPVLCIRNANPDQILIPDFENGFCDISGFFEFFRKL